jgi:hypothetical protein
VLGGDLGLAGGDPEERLAIDDEARHASETTGPTIPALSGRTSVSVRPSRAGGRSGGGGSRTPLTLPCEGDTRLAPTCRSYAIGLLTWDQAAGCLRTFPVASRRPAGSAADQSARCRTLDRFDTDRPVERQRGSRSARSNGRIQLDSDVGHFDLSDVTERNAA